MLEGMFQTAAKKGSLLKDLKQQYNDGILTEAQYSEAADAAKSGILDNVMGGATSILSGISTLATNAITSSQIADTSKYHNQIDNIYNLGSGTYNTTEQLVSDYSNLGSLAIPTMEEVRGMNTGQKIGSVASSVASGAMTGLTVGGPWGALAGGAVGLVTGLGGVLSGDAKARVEAESLNMGSQYAELNARRNLDVAGENLADRQTRSRLNNIAAKGGAIDVRDKRTISLEGFAKRALAKPRMRQMEPSARVIRTRKNGGVCIRVKR